MGSAGIRVQCGEDASLRDALQSDVPDPKTWATGDDNATPKQTAFLKLLCEEHGVAYDPSWSKGEASAKIDELKKTPAEKQADVTEAAGEKGELLQNPGQWTTGSEAATGKQKRYIAAMASRLGEDPSDEIDDALTKSAASAKIETLKSETGM
ncbi:hypothetical protein CALCODRAFT_486009 [Calocera cornea HHB12733]|uniref:DUF3072 domain-containing protein n=1 Tax=Calocera cornea HHB12733 TaxID=1353952 RepID=A0A165E0A7_9BASI|nr:hypothetical protein CALCODRAFT_486009 [Calocera cornea HHB12733]